MEIMNELTQVFNDMEDAELIFNGRNYYGQPIFKFKGIHSNENLLFIIIQDHDDSYLSIEEYKYKKINGVQKFCKESSDYKLELGPMGVHKIKIN